MKMTPRLPKICSTLRGRVGDSDDAQSGRADGAGVVLRDLDDGGLLDEEEGELLEVMTMPVPWLCKATLERREPGSECGGERGRCGESDAVRKVSVVERGEEDAVSTA